MGIKILLLGVQIAFAVNVEAPPEIAELVLAYAEEAGAGYENAILRVNVAKNRGGNDYLLKLMDKYSGKTIKKIEFCSAGLPNIELQHAVLEIFGQNAASREGPLIGEGGVLGMMGAGLAAAGLAFYYSKPPKPVYGYRIREAGR